MLSVIDILVITATIITAILTFVTVIITNKYRKQNQKDIGKMDINPIKYPGFMLSRKKYAHQFAISCLNVYYDRDKLMDNRVKPILALNKKRLLSENIIRACLIENELKVITSKKRNKSPRIKNKKYILKNIK